MDLRSSVVAAAILKGGLDVSKQDLILQLLEQLAQHDQIERDWISPLAESVMRREALGSTGIGGGLAVPHCKSDRIHAPLVILARCENPVDFDSLDQEPVDLISLCLAPRERPGSSMRPLPAAERLMRLYSSESVRASLRQASTGDELLAALRQADAEFTG